MLRLWKATYNIGNIPHLATYCGTKELTYNRYSCSSLDGLLLGNKQLGDLTIASGERETGSSHINSAV